MGWRKRIDLGRALAMEPKVLFMDEPMAGMNLEEKEDMARFIIDIREARDIPIVIIEHDMQVVMDIADRIYVLNWGRLIAEGQPEEIKTYPEVIRAYLGRFIKMKNTTSPKKLGALSEILDQGVETLPQLLVYQARRFGDQFSIEERFWDLAGLYL